MTLEETILSGVFVLLAAIYSSWWDNRRRTKEMHEENKRREWEMHTQNQQEFATIKTKLEPIWRWWNKTNGDDS